MALKAEEVYAILKKQIQSGGATPEQIKQAVDAYLEENPVQPGATVEQVAQIEKNKADISSVKEDVSSLSEDIKINENLTDTLQETTPMKSESLDGFVISDSDNNVGGHFYSKKIWDSEPYNKKYGWGGHPYGDGELPPYSRSVGIFEADMFSVRGGKGRWNKEDTGNFKHGGHLFEGWNAEEDARLTCGIGLDNKDIAWIQTFHPATDEGTDGGSYYCVTKIGSDIDNQGVNFLPTVTQYRSLLCLKVGNNLKPDPKHIQELVDTKELVDWEYNKTDMVPYGAMYFSYDENKVKVYTRTGWKTLKFEEDS